MSNQICTRTVILLLAGIVVATTANAGTLHVPSQYATIQAAINAAQPGDEVVVADGTYTGAGNKNLDFGGKDITVRSENGPENCVIDCQDDGRGFYFHSGETEGAIVDGFTIQNGYVDSTSPGGSSGGGVLCVNTGPTITNCAISGNTAAGDGGGICCDWYSSPTIVMCLITENEAEGFYGGGVYCDSYSNPTITNCTIMNNAANTTGPIGYGGGGIYCGDSSNPSITDCAIEGNAARSYGGGIYCRNSDPVMTDCAIEGNTAGTRGGGVYCLNSDPVITDCTITGNVAGDNSESSGSGAGVYCGGSNAAIISCVIMGNVANSGESGHGSGGGVHCSASSPTIINCVIMGNAARDSSANSACGGGVYCDYDSSPAITNCVIAGNTAEGYEDGRGRGGGVHCYSGSLTITNCTIVGNTAQGDDGHGGGIYCEDVADPTIIANCILWSDTPEEIYIYSSDNVVVTYSDVQGGWTGAGNIDANPQLGAGYQLDAGSPCIDAGDNTAVAADTLDLDDDGDTEEPLPVDLDGNPRFADDPGMPDTGNGTPPIVDIGACEFQGETTPVMWYVDDDALNDPGPGDPTVSDPNENGSPEHPFDAIQKAVNAASGQDTVLVADGTYTGPGNKNLGFGGKAITVQSENGPESCVIDCQDDGRGFYFHSGETEGAIVDGFTIQNGYVDSTSPGGSNGGGVYCSSSSPTITNCTITQNTADNDGGGVCCSGCNATIVGCTITGNTATGSGGGIYGDGSAISDCAITGNVAYEGGGVCASSSVVNCTIAGNTAEGVGGGIYGDGSTISDCTITGNVAWEGGGVGGGASSVVSCTIAGNTAAGVGGGVCYVGGPLTYCTITDNTAGGFGGGVYCGYANPTITNCTIAGNASEVCGGGVYCCGSNPTISDCIISGNFAMGIFEGNGAGIYFDSDLGTIVNCVVSYNTAINDGGGFYCGDGSLAVINCTITYNFAFFYGGGIATCSSQPTIRNCILWGDTASLGAEIALLDSGDELRAAYCDIQGGQAAVHVNDGATLVWGLGNIESDPVVLDPNVSDYHLSPGSPCIDAGDNLVVTVDTDLDGNPRFVDDPDTPDTGFGTPPIVDMGAYEFQVISCPGDLDGDNDVDLSDLAELLGNYGTTSGASYEDGDLDGDGDVDLTDLAALLAVYGTTCD